MVDTVLWRIRYYGEYGTMMDAVLLDTVLCWIIRYYGGYRTMVDTVLLDTVLWWIQYCWIRYYGGYSMATVLHILQVLNVRSTVT